MIQKYHKTTFSEQGNTDFYHTYKTSSHFQTPTSSQDPSCCNPDNLNQRFLNPTIRISNTLPVPSPGFRYQPLNYSRTLPLPKALKLQPLYLNPNFSRTKPVLKAPGFATLVSESKTSAEP